jgi:hypothetical protein
VADHTTLHGKHLPNLTRNQSMQLHILLLSLTLLRCSAARISLSADSLPTAALKSNQAWKSARLPKMSGSRKLSRLHSSPRLFCSGVPAARSSRRGHQ